MSKEIIQKIEDVTFKHKTQYSLDYDGIIVTTNLRTIKAGIANGQQCCENYGYLTSADSLTEFIGATLISVDIVDKCLKKEQLNGIHEDEAIFINFETDKGTLQFTAYNSHNGYYGHQVLVISTDGKIKFDEYL